MCWVWAGPNCIVSELSNFVGQILRLCYFLKGFSIFVIFNLVLNNLNLISQCDTTLKDSKGKNIKRRVSGLSIVRTI